MSEASKTPETREQQEARLDAMLVDKLVGPLHRQLAEALDRAQRVEQDIQAYRGALGYTVPAKYDGRLSDGTVPRCGICEAQSSKIAELEKALREALDGWRGHVLATSQQDMPGQCERITELDALASSGQGAKGIAKDSGSSDPAS